MNLGTYSTKSVPIPVICIGNATAGGSGKTPTSIAISEVIKRHKLFESPYFLTRGYGGSSGESRIITGHEPAHDTGDEPLILSKYCKTCVSVNRYDGATLVHNDGADCIIMDDGLQNMGLKKDVSLLVIDGNVGFGNLKTLPAGPLREPATEALERVDAIIMIGDDKTAVLDRYKFSKPVFHAEIKPIGIYKHDIDYIAFAGLGRPEKFYNTLNDFGLKVQSFHKFADHQPYSVQMIEKLVAEARLKKCSLITTEKDMHRIPAPLRAQITEFKISLAFNDDIAVANFLKKKLK